MVGAQQNYVTTANRLVQRDPLLVFARGFDSRRLSHAGRWRNGRRSVGICRSERREGRLALAIKFLPCWFKSNPAYQNTGSWRTGRRGSDGNHYPNAGSNPAGPTFVSPPTRSHRLGGTTAKLFWLALWCEMRAPSEDRASVTSSVTCGIDRESARLIPLGPLDV